MSNKLKDLRVKCSEADRAGLLHFLFGIGYHSTITGRETTDVKEVLDDTPYLKYPVFVISHSRKYVDFGGGGTVEWPKDSTEIIEYSTSKQEILVTINENHTAALDFHKEIVTIADEVITFKCVKDLYEQIIDFAVPLGCGYDAILDLNTLTIKVGCQNIPYKNIKNLYTAITN